MKNTNELKTLPVYPYLDEIAGRLLSSPSRFLVLTAETGAGKSTAVPIAFLPQVSGKIVMLEPRRLATIAIADRIAALLGEKTGETAGYRVHLENRTGERTRIEIMTEAILTRQIQNDPALAGVSVVILDEFHERSIHSDLALTLLKEIVSLRDDLYVVVMSATIDTERIARFLSAPVMDIPGRRFPVEIEHAPALSGRTGLSIAERAARCAERCLSSPGGNILVFLPGIREIRKARELLSDCGAEVLILHSSVPMAEQRKVLDLPDAGVSADRRRIILSSSIAETSLTVPGVSIVIDSGLARVVRFNIATGMDRLVSETESEFQATQRAGRAGRTGPGRCVRLWSRNDVRVSAMPPEITRTDIVPLVLECALWGVASPGALEWLDTPNEASWNAARGLLADMDAIDRDGKITERGKQIAELGLHPRLAAVVLAGGLDLAVKYSRYSENPRELGRFRQDLLRRLARFSMKKTDQPPPGAGSPAMALLAGYPDRIARHRENGVYQFPSGRLAALQKDTRYSTARYPRWIVAPDVDAGEREGTIYAFEELPEAEAENWLARHAIAAVEVSFPENASNSRNRIRKTERLMYGKLVLAERQLKPEPEDTALAVCSFVRQNGLRSLPWSAEAESFLARARFAAHTDRKGEAGTSVSDEALLDSLEEWLLPFMPIDGKMTESLVLDALRYRFDGNAVDRDAPVKIALPNGISRNLAYEELVPGAGPVPILEIRIQDLFGCAETPRVSGEPVLLRLLSPARRPLQITRDLAGFWENTWSEVRKEMRSRYPKHRWPEDPLVMPERTQKR